MASLAWSCNAVSLIVISSSESMDTHMRIQSLSDILHVYCLDLEILAVIELIYYGRANLVTCLQIGSMRAAETVVD